MGSSWSPNCSASRCPHCERNIPFRRKAIAMSCGLSLSDTLRYGLKLMGPLGEGMNIIVHSPSFTYTKLFCCSLPGISVENSGVSSRHFGSLIWNQKLGAHSQDAQCCRCGCSQLVCGRGSRGSCHAYACCGLCLPLKNQPAAEGVLCRHPSAKW